MGPRRIARETALQFLYQEDFTVVEGQGYGHELADRFPFFCSLYQIHKKSRDYAQLLVAGVCGNLEEIDAMIGKAARNWRLSRLSATDRNLLRIAVYEMVFRNDIPGEVAINEAVEISKKYASEESPKFINGILDSIFAGLPAKDSAE